jgi:hypothetical protein
VSDAKLAAERTTDQSLCVHATCDFRAEATPDSTIKTDRQPIVLAGKGSRVGTESRKMLRGPENSRLKLPKITGFPVSQRAVVRITKLRYPVRARNFFLQKRITGYEWQS